MHVPGSIAEKSCSNTLTNEDSKKLWRSGNEIVPSADALQLDSLANKILSNSLRGSKLDP